MASPVNPVDPVANAEPPVESLKPGSREPVAVEVPSMPQTVRPAPEADVAFTTSAPVEKTTIAVEKPATTVAKPVAVEAPVVIDKPGVVVRPAVAVVDKPLVVEGPVAVEKPVRVSIERPGASFIAPVVMAHPVNPVDPVANAELPVESLKPGSRADESQEVGASVHPVVMPMAVDSPSVPQAVQAMPEVAAVSAASARTEAIVETVNQIVEAVVGQILVTPGIEHGECEIKITLKPTILDGSEITMFAKDGTLTVSIAPTTQEASAAATAALPRLETALAEHVSAFHHVSVALALKKGSRNETI